MFIKVILDNMRTFNELSKANKFEDVLNGRKGAILVDSKNGLIPIVHNQTNIFF